MIVDTRTNEINRDLVYDVCIIGAGAAGITTALELATDSKLNITILEAGGQHFSPEAQSLLQGEVEGDRHPPLWRSRFSGLGGSTQVWAGWCRPLAKRDFETRDYIPNSGWPITNEEMTLHYRRANEICGLGSNDYDLEQWRDLLSGKPLLSDPELMHDIFQVRKLRFNQEYYDDLHSAKNITLYLHCPVMRLHSTESDNHVSHVEIASYDGKISKLKANRFVLATGGVENARLLLLSGSSPETALGNQNDCVGRYFLDHGFIDSGWFIPASGKQDLSYYFPSPHAHNAGQASVRPVITLAPEVMKKEKLLNAAIYFYPSYESHPAYASDAVKATLELWEMIKGKKIAELLEISKADPAWADLWDFCKRIGSRPDYVIHALFRKLVFKDTSCSRWRLRFYYECIPSAENRVTLSQEKDQFGRSLTHLNWRLSDQDIDSALRFHNYLNKLFQKNETGQLKFFETLSQWRSNTETGKHPSGTTRMHEDPNMGVVDKNCKVHGLDNLFIAGSSVFPTTGYANPTLTIVALAIRLAAHLKQN